MAVARLWGHRRGGFYIRPWRFARLRAIPHNSKCRYGERGAADAKPKAQIILDAAKVSAASGGSSEPKQGQRSQSARGFCPRSTMRVPQPDIIEFWQRRCRAAAAGAVLKPSGGNCAVLPLFLFPLPVQSGTAGRCRGQVSALRCRWLFCCAGLWGGRSCRQSSSNRCSAAG